MMKGSHKSPKCGIRLGLIRVTFVEGENAWLEY